MAIDPRLPPGWDSLAFRVQWRGRRLRLSIDQGKQAVEATLEEGEPMTLTIGGERRQLGSAATVVASTTRAGIEA
jgi:trehalose/maltose hydrolase-like predicted phosphorylase